MAGQWQGDESLYRPPPIDGPGLRDRPPFRVKAVAVGVAVDWLGTAVASSVIFLVAGAIAASRYRDEDAMGEYLEQLAAAPDFVILSSLVGLGFVALGGYVCGMLAKHDPIRHAAVMGLISLVAGLALEFSSGPETSGWYPTWFRVLGHALVIPFAVFGGILAGGREAP
jgi:hypothetical protein